MDNLLSDHILKRLRPFFTDDDALNRWVRSMSGVVSSRSFAALLDETGGFPQAATWLKAASKALPRPSVQNIERIHVLKRDAKSGVLKRTTISLDPALWLSLTEATQSSEAALKWLKDTAASLPPDLGGSFSRQLQAEITLFVARSHEIS